MVVWIDVHLAPAIAPWIAQQFSVRCFMMRELGMQRTDDEAVFLAARGKADAILTKDMDFVRLREKHGSPPAVLWLRCGNTSNERLRHVLGVHLAEALRLVQAGEGLVEIGDNT